jgi:hypothetical protein
MLALVSWLVARWRALKGGPIVVRPRRPRVRRPAPGPRKEEAEEPSPGPMRREAGTRPAVTQLARGLKGMDFPASKERLVRHAQERAAGGEVIEAIRRLPERDYASMAEVMRGYGEEEAW